MATESRERFLSQVARAGGGKTLTEALAQWTSRLWAGKPPSHHQSSTWMDRSKPVYTNHLIPRGLIGRTSKILGCRALLLLHDAHGHPSSPPPTGAICT